MLSSCVVLGVASTLGFCIYISDRSGVLLPYPRKSLHKRQCVCVCVPAYLVALLLLCNHGRLRCVLVYRLVVSVGGCV